ncbi:hypothetical protein BVC80_9033g25 [Macleaya cordata]|uniref:Transmembrane protein n=1 Tax=Macleaya cordata TaxID=56857 RepID=A0A200QYJ2_MACCD|nr:hypothetical protein BVC80_9033g25 [Macleaya cordata]
MARFLLVCLMILLADVLAVLAMSNPEKVKTTSSITGPLTSAVLIHSRNLNINAARATVQPRASNKHHSISSKSKPVTSSVPPPASSPISSHDLKGSKASLNIPPQLGGENQPKPLSSSDNPHDTTAHNTDTVEATPATEEHGNEATSSNHDQAAAAAAAGEEVDAEAPSGSRKLGKHHHRHSNDKSVAGGGVILGGLATTFLVSIFCYIRATRRKNNNASETEESLNEIK